MLEHFFVCHCQKDFHFSRQDVKLGEKWPVLLFSNSFLWQQVWGQASETVAGDLGFSGYHLYSHFLMALLFPGSIKGHIIIKENDIYILQQCSRNKPKTIRIIEQILISFNKSVSFSNAFGTTNV